MRYTLLSPFLTWETPIKKLPRAALGPHRLTRRKTAYNIALAILLERKQPAYKADATAPSLYGWLKNTNPRIGEYKRETPQGLAILWRFY